MTPEQHAKVLEALERSTDFAAKGGKFEAMLAETLAIMRAERVPSMARVRCQATGATIEITFSQKSAPEDWDYLSRFAAWQAVNGFTDFKPTAADLEYESWVAAPPIAPQAKP